MLLPTPEASRERRKMDKTSRIALLLSEDDVLLSRNLHSNLKIFCERQEMSGRSKEEVIVKVKKWKFGFNLCFAKSLQYYLPLDNSLLKHLTVLCPKKFVESSSTEVHVTEV